MSEPQVDRSAELDAIEGWAARHRRDVGRLEETADFNRGFHAALDLLSDLVVRRRQRFEGTPTDRSQP